MKRASSSKDGAASTKRRFIESEVVTNDGVGGREETRGQEAEGTMTSVEGSNTFAALGLHPELVRVCTARKWLQPTPIQKEAIPPALAGRDVIGLAVTGSGKTAAFVLPILHSMILRKPHPYYATCISPTRELATQIAEQFNALGHPFQISIATLTGGMNHTTQVKMLAREPHVVVASPGRLVDHLTNTQGFTLANLKFLVLDEADRLLTLDFEDELIQIIKACPAKRQTFLYSATMTSRVSKLQKLSLQKPVKISVDEKTQTAQNLKQWMCLVPFAEKFAYAAALMRKIEAYRSIIFCNTCKTAHVLNAFLRRLGFNSVALSGNMQQTLRLGALRQFKTQEKKILVTTDVGSRGLDLPEVGYVINFDVPPKYQDYIHRVGRTARAGAHGQSFTIVNQHDVTDLAKIEAKTGVKLAVFESISPVDYAKMNFTEAKKAAEKEYGEAVKKKLFNKKKSK